MVHQVKAPAAKPDGHTVEEESSQYSASRVTRSCTLSPMLRNVNKQM